MVLPSIVQQICPGLIRLFPVAFRYAWLGHKIDLTKFQGAGVTSLAQMVKGEEVSVDTVGEKLIGHFEETFNCESRDMEDEERVEFLEGL